MPPGPSSYHYFTVSSITNHPLTILFQNAKKSVAVLLVVSSDGIKVLSQNGKVGLSMNVVSVQKHQTYISICTPNKNQYSHVLTE